MNVVVIGLGSMGKRRIRLLKRYDAALRIFGVDNSEERRRTCSDECAIETYADVNDVFDGNTVDCAFICTSPLSHARLISMCLKRGIHVFSELNLVADGYAENIDLANQNELILFMSSTLLYRDEIREMKKCIKNLDSLTSYTYHVGQYLPDWHPWERYTDYFVSDKRTNACRELFAIELPWLTDVFGPISKAYAIKNKISKLSIDYNDCYLVILEHASGHRGMLAVDIVSRKAVRNLEIYGENLYLKWDGTPEGLKVYDYVKKEDVVPIYGAVDRLEQYSRFVVENAYYDETIAFFKAVKTKEAQIYSFEEDQAILHIIDCIEEGSGYN